MKILLSLPESPFDPTNGAARSMRTIAELMAKAGHQVRCVGTMATEHPRRSDLVLSGSGQHYELKSRGVTYRLVRTPGKSTQNWRDQETEHTFDWLFQRETDTRPDILLCYGGHPTDLKRYERAKRAGVKIVFGLRNYGYQRAGFFDFADGIITSSQFLSDWYRTRFGIESTPLPLPIWPEDVIAENREPKYFTDINPTREKGSMILATVFNALTKTRPDIPLLLIAGTQDLLRIQPEVFGNPMVNCWTPSPKAIFAKTKVLLVPSVWEEPAGRVIAEAMLNGIPPIITDRGGMPEIANGGAIVLPLDKRITPERTQPVSLAVAQPWIDTIIELHDHPHVLRMNSALAKLASEKYLPKNVTPLYEDYFGRILTGTPIPARMQPETATTGAANL